MIKNNQENIVKKIYKTILSYKKVSIFPHSNPDNDTYGSSLALAIFLNNLNIDARIIGMETATNPLVIKQMNPTYHNYDPEFCNDSLAIVVDLGTEKNIINQQLFSKCNFSIRIDHHLKTEEFCSLEWIDTDYCSACEMIGWFILFNNKQAMNKEICNALYPGILTDSGNFMFPSATSSIFDLISIFFKYNFDKQEKQNELFVKQWDEVKTNAQLIKKVKIVNNEIAYIVITPRLKRKYKLADNDSKVFLMANVENIKIWFSVYYSDEKKTWKVSIRSKLYPVNEVAKLFKGGGHRLASGFTIKSKEEIKDIILAIENIIYNEYPIK